MSDCDVARMEELMSHPMDETDQARLYLVRQMKSEYCHYIIFKLAGDFAVEISKKMIELKGNK